MSKKKLSPKIIQWIQLGMFPGWLMFSVGFDYDDLMKKLKKPEYKDWRLGISESKEFLSEGSWFAMRRTITYKGKKPKDLFYIIFRNRFDFTDLSMCKMAHEVLHICQLFLPDILNRNTEIEAEAYLHTYIMEHCLNELRKPVKKKKSKKQ